MKYNRFLPLLVVVFVAALSEIFFFWPQMIYVIFVLAVLLFFFVARQFTKASSKNESWWNYLILPAFFFSGLIVFSSMIPNRFLVQLLFFLNIIFIYIYFRTIYYYLIKTDYYRNYSMENLSAYGNFLTFYFIASAVYGFQSFLNISVWFLIIIMLAATGLIVYQVMWTNKIDIQIGFFYILLICLVVTELVWSASFLPLSFYILGLFLSICYYMLIGLVKFYLLDKLEKRVIKLYLGFGFFSILIVLFTSRWM